jgi:hypothetical protein
MTVFIVTVTRWDEDDVTQAIFSTREKADAFVAKLEESAPIHFELGDELKIEEWAVN